MTAQCETTAKRSAGAGMGFFERYLTVWVFLCIVAGIGLGRQFPAAFQTVGGLEIARINLPVASINHAESGLTKVSELRPGTPGERGSPAQ